jgi:hypothetical protein
MTACFECGSTADHDHHVIPQSLGGTKTVPLCARCHSLVHASSLVAAQSLSRAAIEKRRAEGRQPNGSPAYGWRWSNGDVVPHPEEQRAKATIVHLFGEGLGFEEIADSLNAAGLLRRGNARWNSHSINKRCVEWGLYRKGPYRRRTQGVAQ